MLLGPMPTSKSLYDVHPGVAMIQKWIATLKDKTGRSLEEWVALAKKGGPKEPKKLREWLKKEHKLGTNSAWWIADEVQGKHQEADTTTYLAQAEKYVETMYSGGKADLRPLHDALYKLAKGIAKDVRCCPCQTIVPFYRNHVIAQIKPSTQTRIDFGLALGATKTPARLIDTGGLAKKDRITHRFEITSLKDIDGEVKRWLQKAYDMDA